VTSTGGNPRTLASSRVAIASAIGGNPRTLASSRVAIASAIGGNPRTLASSRVAIASFDPADPAFVADPYPAYARLREAGPQWCESAGVWLIGRHAQVAALLRDRRLGRVFRPREPAERFVSWNMINQLNMLELEPPDHPRQRRLVSRAFTPRTVQELRPRIRRLCDQLVSDALAENGQLDVVGALAEPLPVAVIGALLGIPEDDWVLLRPWSNAIVAMFELDATPEAERAAEQAAAQFVAYLQDQIADRRRSEKDDLLTALVLASDGADRLSVDEVVAISILLLNAGHEATVNVIGAGAQALAAHPEQLALLPSDPEQLNVAADELVRYDTPLSMFARTAFTDIDLGGMVVPAGQRVGLLLGSANRDPEAFARPAELDVTRADNPHVGFGGGIHYCLGAPLARIEIAEALGSLLRRGRRWDVMSPPAPRTTWQFRGPTRLVLGLS
jgi:cytochrome P450